jgi:hypothetical protein
MLKDLRLVQEHAQALNVPLPGTALVTRQYVDARAHGEGANGNQALFRVYDRVTNQSAGDPIAMNLELDFPAVLERWPNFLGGAR